MVDDKEVISILEHEKISVLHELSLTRQLA